MLGDVSFGPPAGAWSLGSAWPYRARLQIVGVSGSTASPTVTVCVSYRTGMRTDFGDVRFTTPSGTTLDCLRLGYADSKYATFAVRLLTVPAAGGASWIFVYWGNPAATHSPTTSLTTFHDDFSSFPTPGFCRGWGVPELITIRPTASKEMDPVIVRTGTTNHLWYDKGQTTMARYATSNANYPRGWARDGTDISVSSFGGCGIAGANFVCSPSPFRMPDGSWRMYCSVGITVAGQGVQWHGFLLTCSAVEYPDTWHWYSQLLLSPTPGAWDEGGVQAQAWFPPEASPDGKWHCIYGGYDLTAKYWRLGVADSDDGLTWTKRPNPLPWGPSRTFDQYGQYPAGGWAWKNGVMYISYVGYDGWNWRAGVLTTTDFVTFARLENSPVKVEESPGSAFGTVDASFFFLQQDAPEGSVLAIFGQATTHPGGHFEADASGGGYELTLSLPADSVSTRLDPSKWLATNWAGSYGDIVQPYPQPVNHNALIQLSASTSGNVVMQGTAVVDSGTAEFAFSLDAFPDGSAVYFGFGRDPSNYLTVKIAISGTTVTAYAETVIGGVATDSAGLVIGYTQGVARVVRSGGYATFFLQAPDTGKWTQLGSAVAEAVANLNLVAFATGTPTITVSGVALRDAQVEPVTLLSPAEKAA